MVEIPLEVRCDVVDGAFIVAGDGLRAEVFREGEGGDVGAFHRGKRTPIGVVLIFFVCRIEVLVEPANRFYGFQREDKEVPRVNMPKRFRFFSCPRDGTS